MKTSVVLAAACLAGWLAVSAAPADAATQVFSKRFSYSGSLTGGQTGVSIVPSGVLSASLGPSTLRDLTSVTVDWSFSENFSGNTGQSSGGMNFTFGGTVSVDGVGYSGAGGGNGNGGPPDEAFSVSASQTSDETLALPNSPPTYNPLISRALTGSTPITFSWAVNDSANSGTTVYGTLSATGEVIVTFIGTAPEPAAWALMLVGVGAVGGLARRRSASLRQA